MLVRLANRPTRAARRRGVTIVECTLIMGVFLMLLFGLFEYCRFLMVLHITNNAARDGARYASVRINTSPSQVSTVQASIISYTTSQMGGMDKNISGYQVAVFAVDPTGLTLSPPVVRPVSKTGSAPYPNPFNGSDPNAVPWNTAAFPNRVAVTIQGTYKPIVPVLIMMPANVPINVTATMAAEG